MEKKKTIVLERAINGKKIMNQKRSLIVRKLSIMSEPLIARNPHRVSESLYERRLLILSEP